MPMHIAAQELHTRLLLPFVTTIGLQDPIRIRLSAQRHDNIEIWSIPNSDESVGAYSQDLLPDLKRFLFANGTEGCVYASLNQQLAQAWLRNRFRVLHGHKLPASSTFMASLLPSPGIELIVSPLGAGVLSIALRLVESTPVPLASILDFMHDIAQLIPTKSARLELPPVPGQVAEDDLSIPFSARLGKTGCSIRLNELFDHLVAPIRQVTDLRMLQTQCSAYTVVRCGAECDLAATDEIPPFLSALAQIEEATHAGEAFGTVSLPNELLNRCHWAAVSSMATAHVICDQQCDGEREVGFNAQRLPNARDKYFVPYLVALLQRLALANLVHEAEGAAAIPALDAAGKNRRVHDIRRYVLQLSGQFATYAVSSRDALNRYYRLCEQGMDLGRALLATKQTIDALEECEQNDFESSVANKIDRNVDALTNMQRTVGWLEVFFAAVYGMELFKALGEGLGYEPHFAELSAVAWGALCGCIAALITKPWKHARMERDVVVPITILLVLAICVWIRLGHR